MKDAGDGAAPDAENGAVAPATVPAASAAAGAERDRTIPATDGLPLGATVFEAEAPVAWCSIGSATGVRRRFYARFARHLAAQGISTVTFDYRGIGDSPAWLEAGAGAPPEPPTMRLWGERDLEGVLRWVHKKAATHKRPLRQFHVGHSAGGQFLGLCPANRHVEAMVMVASQAGHWRNWPLPERMLMLLLWYGIVPASTRLKGHFPSSWFGMGEPLPASVALGWARWCRHPDFVVDEQGRPLREHFRSWVGRIRAYSIADDRKFAPRKATEELLSYYAAADSHIVDVAPKELGLKELGHFGFFKERGRPMWDDAVAWLMSGA